MSVELLVALVTGAAVAGVMSVIVRPAPRLGPRLRPYTVTARTALGAAADVAVIPDGGALLEGAQRMFAPVLTRLATLLGRFTDGGGEASLAHRLRHSGLLAGLPPERRLAAYRMKQVSATAGWAAAGVAGGLLSGRGSGVVLALAVLGTVVGAARWPARLDRAVATRRERLRIELYTVNQLLALHVRAGSGVTQALQHVVERGSGALVDELAEVLALHRGGRPLTEALEHGAASTPEPNVARTYRLLANGVAYGVDLADGLRALAAELRQQRTDALRRAATKRRAAMLLPIIAVLAPVMLVFIAAPLPSLVLGAP